MIEVMREKGERERRKRERRKRERAEGDKKQHYHFFTRRNEVQIVVILRSERVLCFDASICCTASSARENQYTTHRKGTKEIDMRSFDSGNAGGQGRRAHDFAFLTFSAR